jgi:hypothetical protein
MNLRHAHGKEVDDEIGIEWLKYVARNQTMVHARVLVLLKLRELLLSNIHHCCKGV